MATATPADAGGAREALLVVGMHRSGTSAVALEFARQGWSLGDSLIETQPGVNRDGFGENRALVEFNERLLSEAGFQWYQLAKLPEDTSSEQFRGWVADAADILASAFPGQQRILLKDPRLCLTLPIWRCALDSAGWRCRVLLQLRHPASVAESLFNRDSIPRATGGLLWAHSTLGAERASRGMERGFVDYEQLLERGVDALRVFPDLAMDDGTAAVIDPALAHYRADGFEALGISAGFCSDVYEALHGADQGQDLDALAGDVVDRLQPGARTRLLDELLEALLGQAALAVQMGEYHRTALLTLDQRDADIEQVRRYAKECEATIERKDRAIAEVSEFAAECEATIERKDRAIAEVSEFAAECEATIEQRDRDIEQVRRYAEECEATIEQKDREVAEASDFAAQCERTVRDKDGEIDEIREYATRCEEAVRLKDSEIAEVSRYAQQCERRIEEVDREIEAAATALKDRDRQLAGIRGQRFYRMLCRLGLLRES